MQFYVEFYLYISSIIGKMPRQHVKKQKKTQHSMKCIFNAKSIIYFYSLFSKNCWKNFTREKKTAPNQASSFVTLHAYLVSQAL